MFKMRPLHRAGGVISIPRPLITRQILRMSSRGLETRGSGEKDKQCVSPAEKINNKPLISLALSAIFTAAWGQFPTNTTKISPAQPSGRSSVSSPFPPCSCDQGEKKRTIPAFETPPFKARQVVRCAPSSADVLQQRRHDYDRSSSSSDKAATAAAAAAPAVQTRNILSIQQWQMDRWARRVDRAR